MVKNQYWEVNGVRYCIRNIPCEFSNGYETIDASVATKVGLLQELMERGVVSNDINFNDIKEI